MDDIVKRVAVAVILLALLCVAACRAGQRCCRNPSPPAPPAAPADHWTATVEREDAGAEPRGAQEHVRIALPEARNGSRDEWDHRLARRFWINLFADGTVWFQQWEFGLMEDDARDRAEAANALVHALERAERHGAMVHGAPDRPLTGLRLHFDRSCAWRAAADCIRAALTAEIPIDRLQVAVRAAGTDSDHAMNLTLSRAEAAARQGPQLHILRSDGRVTEVRIGGRSWAFPAGDEFEAAAFLAGANRQWAQIENEIRALRKSAVASITVGDSVRWAYVVKMLDILLGPTHPSILFAADGFVLSLPSK